MTTAKCRDCQFRTADFKDQLKHLQETGHREWCLIENDEVIIDWIHVELTVKREKPSAG